MTPFHNNLNRGDKVVHRVAGKPDRTAFVHSQPREKSVNVQILYPDKKTPHYVPVEELRLVYDGKVEEVPPYDGELPTTLKRPQAEAPAPIHFETFCKDHLVTEKERVALVSYLATFRSLQTLRALA